jgi:hypothetical protein
MRRTVIGLVLAGVLLASAGRGWAKPAASMTFGGWLVGAGVGFSKLEGELTFEGETYLVTVIGTSLLSVGAARVCGSAQIYGMPSLDALNGRYNGVTFGATLVAGGHGARYAGGGIEIETQLHSMGLDLGGGFERIRVIVHARDGEPAPRHHWPPATH